MGHIHKPQIICPDKIAYAGALEPIDKNETGAHRYIYGESTTKGCRIRFVPFAMRSYIHQTIEVNPSMTEHELKETVAKVIDEKGIKQTWLAEKLGKSFNMVNGYVQNRHQPSLETLYKIAEILNVSVKDLLVDNDEKRDEI